MPPASRRDGAIKARSSASTITSCPSRARQITISVTAPFGNLPSVPGAGDSLAVPVDFLPVLADFLALRFAIVLILAQLLLLFFFVFLLQNRRCGYGIIIVQAQQAHALCGPARLADLIGVHADHLPVVRNDHHVGFFRDLQRCNNGTVALG